MPPDIESSAEQWEFIFTMIFAVGIPGLLIIWGLTVGRLVERRHIRRLADRRAALAHVLVTDLKTYPLSDGRAQTQQPPVLLMAEAVIAADYLKSWLAGIRKIIGGELRSYQTLMFRAREEALTRIIEQANALGYDAVCNVRLDTADVGAANSKQKAAYCAVIASGTAYRRGG